MKDSKVYFLMILSTLFWGGAFIAAKLSAPFIPPFTLTFLRFLIAIFIYRNSRNGWLSYFLF